MSEKQSFSDSVCSKCSQKCCSFHKKNNPEATLSYNEVKRIEQATGHSDFYEEKQSCFADTSYYKLKVTSNNDCVFYDTQKEICTIYDIRPMDCKLYPFDFDAFEPGKGYMWMLNDCLFSQQFDEETIDEMINDFESNYMEEISEIYFCGDTSFEGTEDREGFRILREMKIPNPLRTKPKSRN